MAKLSLKDVTFHHSKGTSYEICALDRVSLDIEAGSVTGIIGHTGSGKSTLVEMFNGILRPESGQVLLDGKDIWEKPKAIRDVRFRVGLVMQYPEYQLFGRQNSFIKPDDPGPESPVGEPWILLAFAAMAASVVYLRQRKAKETNRI